MEEKDIDSIVEKLKSSIEIQVKETVYLQTLEKDKEVSGLHREINQKLKDLQNTFMKDKPDWFNDHEQSDTFKFENIEASLNEIKKNDKIFHDLSEPMLKWFQNMTFSKQANMRILQIISIVIGILVGVGSIMWGGWQALKFAIALTIK